MLELRTRPAAPRRGGRPESSPISRKKAPVTDEKIPCSERKSSLLWEREFPVIFPLMRRVERRWFAKRGPPRRPLSPCRGCSAGVLILVFSKACCYSAATRNFFLLQNQDSCY